VKRDTRRLVRSALLAVAVTAVAACSNPLSGASPATSPTTQPAAPTATPAAEGDLDASPEPTAEPPPTRAAPSVDDADRLAGIRSRKIVQDLGGRLVTVPGDVKAPGRGAVWRVKVQVEKGLGVDGQAFAQFVLDTLNDPRSWGHGGTRTFARTDGGGHDVRVVLASPGTSAEMCLPLRTNGTLSCRNGDASILTFYRWVEAIPGYGKDVTGYRRYVVNHEVGHALGEGHEDCPGRGRRAPVMMQQTKGLLGCEPNPWPHP
jgi:hypothetical protein